MARGVVAIPPQPLAHWGGWKRRWGWGKLPRAHLAAERALWSHLTLLVSDVFPLAEFLEFMKGVE